jgi:HD superfamily phosphohydrolase
MSKLLNEASYSGRKVGAGEILSSFIVESTPFRRFVEALNAVWSCNIDCEQVSKIFTGQLDDDQFYLSEIVHGPFDADKLDYLHRDGMFSGLSMNVDLDRLLSSIRTNTYRGSKRLTGAITGTTPLEQIMFNKMLLHTGIYHHHKVRACDCMLYAVFDLAVKRGKKIGGIAVKEAPDFLYITDDRLIVSDPLRGTPHAVPE